MDKLFSLRRKILILLIAVSLFSGLTFLVISINTFKTDKIAYIFETNNGIIVSVSEQIKNDIRVSTNEVKTLLLGMNQNEDGKVPKKLLKESPIDSLQIYKIGSDDSLTEYSSMAKMGTENLGSVAQNIKDLIVKREKMLTVIGSHIVIGETVQMAEDKVLVIYFFKSKSLDSFFSSEKSYLSFLVDAKGLVVKSDQAAEASYVSENFQASFKNIKSLSSTTLKIETPDYKKWLMTSVPLGYEDYYLVAMTDEDLAMSAVKSLTTKSVLIFALIFLLIVIIGVFTSNYLTSRLSMLTEATQKVIAGDYKFVVQTKGKDEITELANNFNQMTFEIVRLLGETAHKARMESELKTAKAVQETLFPPSEAIFPGLHIKGQYISASECGGDWWHYSENSDSISIWIADATGHGAPAALLTSAAKSAVTLIEKMKVTPSEAMSLLNQAICSVSKENMMMTCFLGVFDKKTRLMKYVNASHEPPIIIKPKDRIRKNDFIFLNDVADPRLGQSFGSIFKESSVQLESKDRILFYTDGIPDIQNAKQQNLGERGFLRLLSSSCNLKLNFVEFADDFTMSLAKYRQSSELIDDVTYCFTEIT